MSIYSNYLTEEINITPEQIRILQEYFEQFDYSEVITESVNPTENLTKLFTKLGIAQQKQKSINNSLQKSSKEIANVIIKNGINDQSKKTISNIISNLKNEILDIVKNIDTDELKFEKYDANKINEALLLFIMMVMANSIIVSVCLIIFPGIGNIIGIGIAGPIIEEFAKAISIKGGFEKEFYVIFNMYEMMRYVPQIKIMNMDIPLSKAILSRLKVAGMHLTTTIIQWISQNEKILEKLNIKKEDHDKIALIGQITGTIIHSTWNILGLKSVKFNNFILGGNYI